MRRLLFTFEEEKMPTAVILATAILISVLALGIVYSIVTGLLF